MPSEEMPQASASVKPDAKYRKGQHRAKVGLRT
jgi:hypothetical protein